MYYSNVKAICENIKKLLKSDFKNIKVKIIYDDEHLIVTFIIKTVFKNNEVKIKHKQRISYNYEELESFEYINLCELILYNLREDLWSFYSDNLVNKKPRFKQDFKQEKRRN